MARQATGTPAPLPEAAPFERDTLHRQVYERVRHAMMSGGIQPGTALSVRNLARALGTSPMPVREALRRLITERALVSLPNRSVILPMPTAKRFAEIRQLRMAIEGMLAAAAASRMTPEAVEALAAVEVEMEAAESGPAADYLALHSDFHFRIYRAADLPVALSITESLWLQTGPMLHHLMAARPLAAWRSEHKAIIAALRAGDGAAARQAVEQDIHDPGEDILALLRSLEGEG